MKVVLQRVKSAAVTVDGREVAAINGGFLLLVGVAKGDNAEIAERLARKIEAFRVFRDGQGKMNLDITEAGGEILSVSQFTLLANTEKGNRPGFDGAASPDEAEALWKVFNGALRGKGVGVKEGEFGARMEVSLVNDGPVTFVLESK